LARLPRNVLFGVCAVVGALAALIGAWWLSVTEPWYEGEVIRQLRSAGEPHNSPWRDETPRLAPLFPDGMPADSARSLLRASGFSCTQAKDGPGEDIRLNCFRETHPLLCVVKYAVELTLDRDRRVIGRSGSSYTVCL
jgi:hypothetical protein